MGKGLLFIAYFAPPAATGVRRLVSLLRHLPRERWRPIVLSVKATRGEGHDEGPLPDMQGVEIHRTGSLDPYRLARLLRGATDGVPRTGSSAGGGGSSRGLMRLLRRFLFVPDDRCGWIPFAVWRGWRLVRRGDVDVIYTSNYPQSAHVVGLALKLLTRVPWLADFRDGWTQNPAFHDPGTPVHAWLQRRLEALVARKADAIVTVSPPITRHLESLRRSGRGARPACTIYNGWEAAEVASSEPAPPSSPLVLLYAGTFFGRRRPELFLDAVAVLLEAHPEWRAELRIHLRCELDAAAQAHLASLSLGDVVQLLPPVPHGDVLAEQRAAAALLLVLETGPGAEIMVSQKIFEYLAARRPVFALVPHGACEELLAATGGATVSPPDSAEQVAARLHAFLQAVRSGGHSLCPREKLQEYRRDVQAAQLARILDSITDTR